MKLNYYGHSTFSLETDGILVVIDPWFTGNPTNTTPASEIDPAAILITHAHNDHLGDALEIATRTGATIVSTVEIAGYLGSQGAKAVGGNFGGTIGFPGGTAKFVPAWHSSAYNLPDGGIVAQGIPAGLVVRFGGQTIYFAGDTGLFGDMQLIGDEELDIAVLPIGDHFTMGPKDAVRAAKLLRARTIIPCHYNTFPAINQDADAFKAEVEASTDSKVAVLKPGDSTEFS